MGVGRFQGVATSLEYEGIAAGEEDQYRQAPSKHPSDSHCSLTQRGQCCMNVDTVVGNDERGVVHSRFLSEIRLSCSRDGSVTLLWFCCTL